MNRFFKKSIVLMALVGGVALSTDKAEAALTLQLTSYNAANVVLGTTGVIADQGAGDAASGTVGAVAFVGGVGNWQLNITGGIGSPVFPDQPHLDLGYNSSSAAAGSAAGDYIVADFTETNAVSSGSGGLSLHIGGTNNNTVTTAYLLVNNVVTQTLGAFATPSYSLDITAPAASSPYTLTQRVVIQRVAVGGANGSGDYEAKNIPDVPEPAMLSLLGLAGAAVVRRRRQAK